MLIGAKCQERKSTVKLAQPTFLKMYLIPDLGGNLACHLQPMSIKREFAKQKNE